MTAQAICAAFILNWCAASSCNFHHLVLTTGNSTRPDAVILAFGFWNYAAWVDVESISGSVIFEGCQQYPEFVEIDSDWKAGRAFSVLALIFGVGMIMSEFLGIFRNNSKRISPLTGGGFLWCSLFSGLSLLLLQSDLCKDNVLSDELKSTFPSNSLNVSSCEISVGAKCAISATILWFLAGAASIRAFKIFYDEDMNAKDSSTVVTDPLLLGYEEFNSFSQRWLHGVRDESV